MALGSHGGPHGDRWYHSTPENAHGKQVFPDPEIERARLGCAAFGCGRGGQMSADFGCGRLMNRRLGTTKGAVPCGLCGGGGQCIGIGTGLFFEWTQ